MNNFDNLISKYFNISKPKDIKIFLVEDEIYYAKLVEVNIKELGYTDITYFSNGETLYEALKVTKPKCIILDHILSYDGLTGMDVLKHVKKHYPQIHVIILSGQENVKIAAEMIQNGSFDYIIKNEMAHLNINNTLSNIKDIVTNEELHSIKDKISRITMALSLLALWFIASLIL